MRVASDPAECHQIRAAQAFARAHGLPVPDGIVGRFIVPPGPVQVLVVQGVEKDNAYTNPEEAP